MIFGELTKHLPVFGYSASKGTIFGHFPPPNTVYYPLDIRKLKAGNAITRNEMRNGLAGYIFYRLFPQSETAGERKCSPATQVLKGLALKRIVAHSPGKKDLTGDTCLSTILKRNPGQLINR
ncbi:MAG: hypothetical protein H6555_02265 [Lewinellaceae bacterium]|nr:hypothetical protein [Lewinellaceae bacterium]